MKKLTSLSAHRKYFVFLLLLLISSFMQSCGSSSPRTKEEAYTVIEKQDVTLTYIIKDDHIYYHRTDGAILFNESPKMKVYSTVTNTSDYGGVFRLYAKLSSQGNTIEFETQEYIAAGSTKELSQEKEINPFSFETDVKIDTWGITAPTVSVDKQVTKYRTVEY